MCMHFLVLHVSAWGFHLINCLKSGTNIMTIYKFRIVNIQYLYKFRIIKKNNLRIFAP